MSGGNTFQFTPPQQQPLKDLVSSSAGSPNFYYNHPAFQPTQLQYSCGNVPTGGRQTPDLISSGSGNIGIKSSMHLKFTICPLEEEKDPERSDTGSSYSSMEALNESTTSLPSDACLNPPEGRQEPVVFPFESVKECDPSTDGRKDQGSEKRSRLLEVTSDYLSQDHRRVSLPAVDSLTQGRFSLFRNKLSASARSFAFGRKPCSSSSGSSDDEDLERDDRLEVPQKTQKSGSLDSDSLAVAADQLRRARSVGPEGARKVRPEVKSGESQRKLAVRRSTMDVIRSTLHLESSDRRRSRSPSVCSALRGSRNDFDVLEVDPKVRSLGDMKVDDGESKSLLRSVLSLPEKSNVEGRSPSECHRASIPAVVIHYAQNASSLPCHLMPSLSAQSSNTKPTIVNSRTSPAPLTELFQEIGPTRHPVQGKSKSGIPRVPSVDSAETALQMFDRIDGSSEMENKASDSNDRSSSGPLSLTLTSAGRAGKPQGGKSSSSGDAGTKVGKSSSSSSGDKKKKTSSWYNPKKIVLSPSYKSRSEDFKRIFKGLPASERLIVEYSCALQKDILIQGRMYVSQSWICFYANIFRWETILMIRCKDIVKLTKEKTARVIPNAIQICTRDDRYFFASFGARDKVFVQLDLVRRNATNESQMSKAEFWSWVHLYYGDDLGLTSDDDDYVPLTPDDKSRFQAYLQIELGQSQEGSALEIAKDALEDASLAQPSSATSMASSSPKIDEATDADEGVVRPRKSRGDGSPASVDYTDCRPDLAGTRRSGSSEDEDDEEIVDYCAGHAHFNIDVLDEAYNMSADDVFHHCFSDSQVYREFVKAKKTFDVRLNPWVRECDDSEQKVRNISYTLTLDFSIGPKHSPSTEKQIMYKESEPGRFYLVDTECINEGIPYGENFFITNRYCISRLSSKRSRLKITSQINYKKNVWGFIKNFLEKNVTAGIIASFNVLADLLRLESDRQLIPMSATSSQLQHSLSRKKYLRRRRMLGSNEGTTPTEAKDQSGPSTPVKQASGGRSRACSVSRFKLLSESKISVDSVVWFVCTVLIMLMLFNGMLFYKLWSLESTATGLLKSRLYDQPPITHPLDRRKAADQAVPRNKASNQRTSSFRPNRKKVWPTPDIDQWRNVLMTSIRLMDRMRASLVELKNNIKDLDGDDVNFQGENGADGEEEFDARSRG